MKKRRGWSESGGAPFSFFFFSNRISTKSDNSRALELAVMVSTVLGAPFFALGRGISPRSWKGRDAECQLGFSGP
jgi:hypothetical protein